MSKKTARIEFRCTPAQKKELLEEAEVRDMTLTELIIQQCLEHPEDTRCKYCFDPIEKKHERVCDCYVYRHCDSCDERVATGQGTTINWNDEPKESYWCSDCMELYTDKDDSWN